MLFAVLLRLLKPRFSVETEPQFFRFRFLSTSWRKSILGGVWLINKQKVAFAYL